MQANSPSDTATLIARALLLSAGDASLSPLLASGEEEAARRMLGERAESGWFGFAGKRGWCRWLLMAFERLAVGGIFAHYLARKRWIEREVRRGIDAGIRQIVVVGAGYDALAWRLHRELPDVEWFEIDHPATQFSKRDALEAAANLHFLPGDLAIDSPSRLLADCPTFDPTRPALVIAEGLTMYFPEQQVTGLLDSMRNVAGTGGRVIFTFMARTEDGSIGFRGQCPAVDWWLRSRREPFQWGCKREDLTAFLEERGLKLWALADHSDLKREILLPLRRKRIPLARGECLCLCEPVGP
ncbi:class I SAM-dependent methyltransferase [Luteolibacter sp. Populi]|uniref:class I SAM-dependent methyltransferase n=1 Tax=Luteolibacter sp. Populi TaxID=3230487 RepID=UPI003466EDFA